MSDDAIQLLATTLSEHDNILCVSHVNPDGDAVGSLLGMGWILRHLGKNPTLALQDPVPESFQFLAGANEVVGARTIASDYDLIICLDASSPDRMGAIYREEDHEHITLAVIDHHITNTNFGDINWVDPSSAATCQMLVELAEMLGVPLTGAVAQCLLTGMVTDTLCFSTNNTDTRVLQNVLKLMAGGVKLSDITAKTLNRRPFSVLKLRGLVLANAQLEEGVIWGTVTLEQRRATGNEENDANLSSSLIVAAEADISATFIEKKDKRGNPKVECSFRAKPGFNVADLAYQMGGGGHPPASGCTLRGTLDEVVARVVPLLQEARRAQLHQASEGGKSASLEAAGPASAVQHNGAGIGASRTSVQAR